MTDMLQNNKQIPRPEYPRPQMQREKWENLNGEWEYATDRAISGKERELYKADSLSERIIVPFCRESVLSGIGDVDFCECCWYLKKIYISRNQLAGRVILNVGACDYKTELWVNGSYVGNHIGGYVSFAFDITDKLNEGGNTVVFRVTDRLRSGNQPGGKQSNRYESYGCSYTRTTGMWQTVWLEFVPNAYIKNFRLYPDVDNKRIIVDAECINADGMTLEVQTAFDGKVEGKTEVKVGVGRAYAVVDLEDLHLWEIGNGRLYDLLLTLGDDKISSYFGMRKIECKDGALILNGKKVFQRLVLDQGFYPDGIYTAPSDKELVADIERSLAMGFNGARLHQKVFEPRFLYHCDRLGYIVWGEHANWGLDISRHEAWQGFIPEWTEVVERDFNHPAIIGWCPLNETQSNQNPEFVRYLAKLTKTLDNTRLYIDASGWTHIDGVTDIMDMHWYEQNPEKFAERLKPLEKGESIDIHRGCKASPTFISEYGGIRWSDSEKGWGYGEAPKTEEEFCARFKALTEALLFNKAISALCYTQLTDVEQEVNGLYTYDRKAKFDPKFFHDVLSQKAYNED